MTDEQFSLLIQCMLMGGAGIVAAVAGFVYVKTNEEHGGFVCLVFALITLSIGGDVYAAAQALN